MKYASAEVRKQFFTDMFTRDISLEDCVLDLIDNSMDSYLLKHEISIPQLIFGPGPNEAKREIGRIDVTCNERQIKVVDKCGGISRKRAMEEIFCFGHDKDDLAGKLGAYGVGMKRALFKIGNKFNVVSRTEKEGFEVSLTVDDWVKDDDWKVPIRFIDGAGSEKQAGTSITITDLRDEVALRIREGGVPKNIHKDAATTYPYFLHECIKLRINETDVDPKPIVLGEREGVVTAARENLSYDGVSVNLVATIAPGARTAEEAGWNILCNGRAVVRANKDDLTGWGFDLASFQPKYRSFVGLASFESDRPLTLPWTTTKRNINRESAVFIHTRNLMVTMSKPILTFLNSQYPSNPSTEVGDIRDAVDGVKPVSFRDIASKPRTGFSYTPPKKKEKRADWIRFLAPVASLNKIRRHLRRPAMSPGDIGRHTLDHFVKTECGTD
jgi:hypothetical protein